MSHQSLRGGMIRGAKPKSAPRRDDPRSPLPRRRRGVVLQDVRDSRPPLERRRKRDIPLPEARGQAAGVDPTADSSQRTEDAGVEQNETSKDQVQQNMTSYMSDAEYDKLAVKRRKVLDAIALRQRKDQEKRQEDQANTEHLLSVSSRQVQHGQGGQASSSVPLPATCGAPFSASTSLFPALSLYQKIVMGHSWIVTKFWSDANGKGQDLFCQLCNRWYSKQHENGTRHLQRCESHGFRPDTEDEAEQATQAQVKSALCFLSQQSP